VLDMKQALSVATGVPVCGYRYKKEQQHYQMDEDSALVFLWDVANRYWNRFLSFSVFPHPIRPYREIVRDFYLSKPPRIDILPVTLDCKKTAEASILDEDWDSSDMKGRTFQFTGRGCDWHHGHWTESLLVMDHIRLEYRTNLQLMWELPLLGLVQKYHGTLKTTDGFLIRFRSGDREDHLLLAFNYIDRRSRWLVRTSYLITDVLVILASLLGYRSIPMNEFVLLMLTWWADALTKLSYNMTLTSCKNSSVFLLSDILNRVESPDMFVKMINSFSRSPHIREWSSWIGDSEIYLGSESIFPRYTYDPVNLKQADFIRVWNLLRTQLGLPAVTVENYLEVTDVSPSPV